VFDGDRKIIQQMAPLVTKVLIVDPQQASARLLGELIRNAFKAEVWAAHTGEKALRLCGTIVPEIIFVELGDEGVDGIEFTRKLRRSQLACRQAPVIILTGQAKAADILAARDAGVHEFLRKPFTVKDLLKRLEAVTLRPRDWIEAVDYVGPDRRRFNSGDYTGPLKRRSDVKATPDEARVSQALKIIRSAINAVDVDPAQAQRALQAQAAELQKVGSAVADLKLVTASADLTRYLTQVEYGLAKLNRDDLEARAAALFTYLPAGGRAAA
jgi:CheY-like chemotaxis protein